jgi:rfaE bifunctional protein nucleotidyltransferase chain/domain
MIESLLEPPTPRLGASRSQSSRYHESKFRMNLNEALSLRRNKRLVFTNGVFDILHAGHVHILEVARSLGDILIVGVNSDESVRRLGKGPSRPVNTLEDRVTVLEALRAVDGAVRFDEDTPITLIEALRPEVHVKGGDYDPEQMPETPIVRAYGGEVVIVPFLHGRSTTEILRRLA